MVPVNCHGLLGTWGTAWSCGNCPMWLVVAYFVSEIGELCVSPIGLSAVTKLAPLRIAG